MKAILICCIYRLYVETVQAATFPNKPRMETRMGLKAIPSAVGLTANIVVMHLFISTTIPATASMVNFYKKFHRKRTLNCFKDIPSHENSNFLRVEYTTHFDGIQEFIQNTLEGYGFIRTRYEIEDQTVFYYDKDLRRYTELRSIASLKDSRIFDSTITQMKTGIETRKAFVLECTAAGKSIDDLYDSIQTAWKSDFVTCYKMDRAKNAVFVKFSPSIANLDVIIQFIETYRNKDGYTLKFAFSSTSNDDSFTEKIGTSPTSTSRFQVWTHHSVTNKQKHLRQLGVSSTKGKKFNKGNLKKHEHIRILDHHGKTYYEDPAVFLGRRERLRNNL